MSAWWSIPSAVDALPCGSMSSTRTFRPDWAMAAATFTVVVVLPTPPFWFATVRIRVCGGAGKGRPTRRDAPPGVLGDLDGERCRVVDPRQTVHEMHPMRVVVAVGRCRQRVPIIGNAAGSAGANARARLHPPIPTVALPVATHRSSVHRVADRRGELRVVAWSCVSEGVTDVVAGSLGNDERSMRSG